VITNEELQYLLDHPDRLPRWRDYLEAGANVYLYDGQIPCNLFVLDETVIIGNSQSEIGPDLVVIETTNETLRSWVLEVLDEYKADATPLDTASFTQTSNDVADDNPC
jgi:hypothetical protein